MISKGYDGLFLDTLGYEQLPPSMRTAFAVRHPQADFNRGQSEFLKFLRSMMGSRHRLFLNQGYRQADLFLPYAHLDLTESYFTAVNGNETLFRPWHSAAAAWESILTPMQQLVQPAASRHPHVRFVHLGYAAGSAEQVRRAIHYNFAVSKLWNHDAYLMMPEHSLEADGIYFEDLGQPLTEKFSADEESQTAWRQFENGLIAVNAGKRSVSILNGRHTLLDPPRGYYFPR